MSTIEIIIISLGSATTILGIAILIIVNNVKKEILDKIKDNDKIAKILEEVSKLLPPIEAIKKYLKDQLPDVIDEAIDEAIEEDNLTDVSIYSAEYENTIINLYNSSTAIGGDIINIPKKSFINSALRPDIEDYQNYFIEDFEFLYKQSENSYLPVVFDYNLREENKVLSIYFNQNTLKNMKDTIVKIKVTYMRK